MPAKKKSAQKKAARKNVVKKAATKKAAAKKAPAAKRSAAKKAPAAKKSAAKKTATKKASVKKQPSPKQAALSKKRAATKKPAATKTAVKKPAKKTAVRKRSAKKAPLSTKSNPSEAVQNIKGTAVSRSVSGSDKKGGPISFSLDDVAEFMATKKSKPTTQEAEPVSAPAKKIAAIPQQPAKTAIEDKPMEKRSHTAASLADILGFNPAEKPKRTELDDSEIPKKYKKYYKLLIELRRHVSDEINRHTSDTLKHAYRDDAGDSASYGNHEADAGTDSFDRDFALSLVSSEQEALNEVEEAILRIKNGSYGVCAVTGKPIPAARLTAVPFARYSVEGQLEHERNQRRKHNRGASGGIFGDVGDAPKLQSSDDDDDE